MSPRAVRSSRSQTASLPYGRGRCLASLLLSLLAAVPAAAQPADRWSLGIAGTNLGASYEFASTGTASPRSTPETVAFASAEVDGMEHFGAEIGFRAHRLLGLKLGWMPGGDMPMSFRAVCAPCELLTTDPNTGEEQVTLITTHDFDFERDLGVDLTTLDVSLFLPLSRRSSSEGRRLEVFLGPTLALLDTSLQRGEELQGVDLDLEIENDVGAHLGLEFLATPSWTIHATGRWFATEMTLDYAPHLLDGFGGQSFLALNAPLGSSKSDWILVSVGTSWRF
jgi:hypothetical protein